jgi:hypothetical protein
MRLDHSAAASETLLADLRSDRGMDWVPAGGWLTKVAIDADAPQLTYDLAVDASGQGAPSRVAAGLDVPAPAVTDDGFATRFVLVALFALGSTLIVLSLVSRSPSGLTPAA